MRMSRWTLFATALTLPALLASASPADAQIIYRQWSYQGPYLRPPAYVRSAPLPPDEIIDIMAEHHRYRRIGHPQFAGHMYVVDGIDRSGATVRSYVDAYSGRLIDVDVLRPAPSQSHRGPRIARLPGQDDRPQASPQPPRRPSETRRPSPEAAPARREASRPAIAPAPALPTTTTRPSASPIVPLSREPRVANPAEVRIPVEADRTPPLARSPTTEPAPAPQPPAPALVAPSPQPATQEPIAPRASARQSLPAPPSPGASPVAPAPLDDAVRRPATPSTPALPASPLL